VQRLKRAVPPTGDARPRWELEAELLRRIGGALAASSPREVFALLAKTVPDYAGLDYKALGATGRALPLGDAPSAQEARV
jgi:predicted molibdopterin-dependent oxidoreductase YjgC